MKTRNFGGWILSYTLFCSVLLFGSTADNERADRAICISGSLVCAIQETLEDLDTQIGRPLPDKENHISFEETDVLQLWNTLQPLVNDYHKCLLQEAFAHYTAANELIARENVEEAVQALNLCDDIIQAIWRSQTECNSLKAKGTTYYNGFDTNPYISTDARKAIKPWLLPENNACKPALDSIFLAQRAIMNKDALRQAGFVPLKSYRSQSYITIARHPLLPGYLMKAYLDSELRKKFGKSHWYWLSARCQGASQLRSAISSIKSKYFTVPNKWLYPLPVDPSPPSNDSHYARKYVVLIENDMDILSQEETYRAWNTQITKDHLIELYRIISRAGGSSYRPDNMPPTRSGKFAFIDTEYPDKKTPHYSALNSYLNPTMSAYWKQLVKSGGSR